MSTNLIKEIKHPIVHEITKLVEELNSEYSTDKRANNINVLRAGILHHLRKIEIECINIDVTIDYYYNYSCPHPRLRYELHESIYKQLQEKYPEYYV